MMERKHKSFKLLFLMAMATSLIGQTNNFVFTQQDTNYYGSDDFVVLHGEIISLTEVPQNITVTRVTHESPATWSTSFCVGPACLPPFLDTYTFELAGLDTSQFTLDTFPYGEEGMGSWTIYAADSSTMEVDSVHIQMEFVTVGIDITTERPGDFELTRVFPNPTNAAINVDLGVVRTGEYSVTLYDLAGKVVTSRQYYLRAGSNQLQWTLHGVPSGNYLISITGAQQTISRQVSVIK